jgi:hypothetical protein
MDLAQRLLADESLQSLDAESEFAEGEGSLMAQTSNSQPSDVFVGCVIRAIDDPQILSAPALGGRLGKATFATEDEIERFHDHRR